MIHQLRSVKDDVYLILNANPETRDNDRLLMIKVWCRQNHLLRPDPRTGRKSSHVEQFFVDFLAGHYVDPETIRRCRQKLQEQNPKLRGEKYDLKHKIADDTREEIGLF